MSELVKQLREYGAAFDDGPGMFKDAADRIEAQEERISLYEITLESRDRNIADMRLAYQALEAENARLRDGWVRYEIVRRMHVQAFKEAQELCRRTGKPFDDIVIELAPFYNVKSQP